MAKLAWWEKKYATVLSICEKLFCVCQLLLNFDIKKRLSSESIASIGPAILGLTLEQVVAQFEHVSKDECYGGLSGCTRESEEEYVSIHFKNLQAVVRECMEQQCGLIAHFW